MAHLPEIFILLGTLVGLYALTMWFLFRGASDVEPPKPKEPTPLPTLLAPRTPSKIKHTLSGSIRKQLDAIEQRLKQPVPVPPPAPPPAPVPVPAPAPTRERAPVTARIRLVSAKGRALTTAPILLDARQRRPVYRHRTKDGLVSVFVADRQDTDGVWIYRRVGVEREG